MIRRTHPNCDFRVIAGAGHWAMYERPEAFNAALLDMLKTYDLLKVQQESGGHWTVRLASTVN